MSDGEACARCGGLTELTDARCAACVRRPDVPLEIRERRHLGGPITVAHADQFAALLDAWDGQLDASHRDADVHLLYRVDWSDGFEDP